MAMMDMVVMMRAITFANIIVMMFFFRKVGRLLNMILWLTVLRVTIFIMTFW